MSENTVMGRTMQRARDANGIKAALVGAVVMFLADNGITKLLDRVFPDNAKVLAEMNVRLQELQKSVDQLWKIKGPRQPQVEP